MIAGFPRDALFLIAGPCVLEDDNLNLRVGEALARLADSVPGGIVYKASFSPALGPRPGCACSPTSICRRNVRQSRRSSTICKSPPSSVGKPTSSKLPVQQARP